MDIHIADTKQEIAAAAAGQAASMINTAIEKRNRAVIVLATGASQFDFLSFLVQVDIDWAKVSVFHLDEYIGLADTHPASFRRYLLDRFVSKVHALDNFHAIRGDAEDIQAEISRLNTLISSTHVDLACIGIGENAHLAFNDPPADFETQVPYLVVTLDQACRKQQVGEGWFESIDSVPRQAISMSVAQILKSTRIVCTVPDRRKAPAVQAATEGEITNQVPASILQAHLDCHLYLDKESASLLQGRS